MHPLAGDLSKLTDQELANKITELYDKLRMSYYGSYADIHQQLRMLLENYRAEQQRRFQKQQEEFAEKNKKLTDKIRIKKSNDLGN